jgi:Fic family protein
LGRLDMFSQYVDIGLFISMHYAKEATLSSRIEGTRTSMEDVFMPERELEPELRLDRQEVLNYIHALKEHMESLASLPVSTRLIRQLHHTLMQGVRGMDKRPGEFRTSQNWIGGASLNDARFVPPPHGMISELMGDLEKFAHEDRYPMPVLLKAALIHYQFETIHPFLDGNGRVGRLLIPIYLVSMGVLTSPVLYLSDFLERHRQQYYDHLMQVRTHHDLAGWFKFFLTGVAETAIHGVRTFDGILQLQKTVDQRLSSLGHRAVDAQKVMRYLYVQPVADAAVVASLIGKSPVSAYKLIADMERLGILRERSGSRRNRVYLFIEYLALFQGPR